MKTKTYLLIILIIIFFTLSLIHFNWALGGEWGINSALPTTEKGMKVLNPTAMDSTIVGLGLLIFGLFYLLKVDVLAIDLPKWILNVGGWVIPIIFTLRAIGDFEYIGFFKQIQQTEFAELDTIFYSPLCLLIGVTGIVVALSKSRV